MLYVFPSGEYWGSEMLFVRNITSKNSNMHSKKKRKPEPVEWDDDGPLQKCWACGDRRTLMEMYLMRYMTAHSVKCSKAREVGDEAANDLMLKHPHKSKHSDSNEPSEKAAAAAAWTLKM